MIECLILFSFQGLLGAFDTLYHHEITERLPWRKNAKKELLIHGIRSFLYSVIFLSIAWVTVLGIYAWLFLSILIFEVLLTLWDFVIEDMTRKLPKTERITHTILAINFGAILAFLIPIFITNANQSTGLYFAYYGFWSWLMTLYGIGVLFWAGRDLFSAYNRTQQDNFPVLNLVRDNMKFLVTGGSGFIGSRLCQALINEGHDVTILTRDKQKTASQFKGKITLIDSLKQTEDDYDVLINLAGESLTNGRWTQNKKKVIYNSRLETTQALIDYIARAKIKPKLLINGSAIGYYGNSLMHEFTENDLPIEKDFGHDLCRQWEEKAYEAQAYGVRVSCLRTGLVLGLDGGALSRMLFPFEFCFGGKMGDGKQWMSWIHLDDLIGIIAHIINDPALEGAVNGTAPIPVTNEAFTLALGKVMNRPVIFTLPAFVLKLLLGEMADNILLRGQKVIPEKALKNNYIFKYKHIDEALRGIFHGHKL